MHVLAGRIFVEVRWGGARITPNVFPGTHTVGRCSSLQLQCDARLFVATRFVCGPYVRICCTANITSKCVPVSLHLKRNKNGLVLGLILSVVGSFTLLSVGRLMPGWRRGERGQDAHIFIFFSLVDDDTIERAGLGRKKYVFRLGPFPRTKGRWAGAFKVAQTR